MDLLHSKIGLSISGVVRLVPPGFHGLDFPEKRSDPRMLDALPEKPAGSRALPREIGPERRPKTPGQVLILLLVKILRLLGRASQKDGHGIGMVKRAVEE